MIRFTRYLYILLLGTCALVYVVYFYSINTSIKNDSRHSLISKPIRQNEVSLIRKKKTLYKPAKFYAQNGQDRYVDSKFTSKKLKNGRFVEIGALRGKEFSNTWYFEKAYDWKGVLIEAEARYNNSLTVNRPLSKVYNRAACPSGVERVKFASSSVFGWGGIFSYLDEKWKKKVHSVKEVGCVTINDVLEPEIPGVIDYMTIDTEGSEFDIVKAINFTKFNITYLQVETLVKTEEDIVRKYFLIEHLKKMSFTVEKVFKLGHKIQDILFKNIYSYP